MQRAELLEAGQAKEKVLTLADLHAADGIRLSNALRGWIDVTLRAEPTLAPVVHPDGTLDRLAHAAPLAQLLARHGQRDARRIPQGRQDQ